MFDRHLISIIGTIIHTIYVYRYGCFLITILWFLAWLERYVGQSVSRLWWIWIRFIITFIPKLFAKAFAAEKLLIGALWKVCQGLANLPVHNHIAFARGHQDDASCGGHNSVNGWHQPSREREDKCMQVTAYLIILDIFTLEIINNIRDHLFSCNVKKEHLPLKITL